MFFYFRTHLSVESESHILHRNILFGIVFDFECVAELPRYNNESVFNLSVFPPKLKNVKLHIFAIFLPINFFNYIFDRNICNWIQMLNLNDKLFSGKHFYLGRNLPAKSAIPFRGDTTIWKECFSSSKFGQRKISDSSKELRFTFSHISFRSENVLKTNLAIRVQPQIFDFNF